LGHLLETLRDSGHRALVFSQFTQLLRTAHDRAEAVGFECAYLDGKTPVARRQHEIDRFQAGCCDAFFISLKAGGTGLNLTAADFVVHLDPWWNPAVEDQASDRAHRIGQERAVTIYRLVSENTIEERVLELHAEKRALVESVLGGTSTPTALSVEDLLALMQ
jgi:SNF2 family DNA or RNA helicase